VNVEVAPYVVHLDERRNVSHDRTHPPRLAQLRRDERPSELAEEGLLVGGARKGAQRRDELGRAGRA
jgi:hypothetical protein